jgi:hypothetical protein
MREAVLRPPEQAGLVKQSRLVEGEAVWPVFADGGATVTGFVIVRHGGGEEMAAAASV